MRLSLSVFLIFIVLSCNHNDKKLSIVALNFDCTQEGIQSDKLPVSLDFIHLTVLDFNPHLVIFQNACIGNEYRHDIELQGYKIIDLSTNVLDSTLVNSTILLKNDKFDLLASSTHLFNDTTFILGANVLNWAKLRYRNSGHIFFVFDFRIQNDLNAMQLKWVSYNLMYKINEVTAGAPVIIIGDFYDQNRVINTLITKEWRDMYSFKEVVKNSNENTRFYVNDFLKVKNTIRNTFNDTLVSNIIISFSIRTQNISPNSEGEILPILK